MSFKTLFKLSKTSSTFPNHYRLRSPHGSRLIRYELVGVQWIFPGPSVTLEPFLLQNFRCGGSRRKVTSHMPAEIKFVCSSIYMIREVMECCIRRKTAPLSPPLPINIIPARIFYSVYVLCGEQMFPALGSPLRRLSSTFAA
ncbi:hypothetical protein JTE90_006539 [Oedothorax gibbosus]|uniref:Uncharacterized protein n=1 Tax=Oedothorax gibbosus TaxID=931172 RepID=A0AAV6VL35_9ARAC|nr:hypothetical protein JTE90_006539 [Oedothorax gibbosus]